MSRKRNRTDGGQDFAFEPVNFNIPEILQSAQQSSKLVDVHHTAVLEKHKTYKSTKVSTDRANLYDVLLKYLRARNVERLAEEKYFKKLDANVFTTASSNSQSFKNLSKEDQKKKTAQKLTKNILDAVSERKVSSMICYLTFLDVIDRADKKKWSSYSLRGAQDTTEGLLNSEGMAPFAKKVKLDVLHRLDGHMNEDTDYFAEYAVEDKLGFIGISRGNQHNTKTRSVTKRSFACYAFELGSSMVYLTGSTLSEVLEAIVPALGFIAYIPQSLSGTGLAKLMENRKRELHPVDMKDLKRKLDEQETKRSEEGIKAFNPKREKLANLHAALLHDERDPPNLVKKFHIDFCTPHLTEDGEVDETKGVACSKTTITIQKGNADEYFAQMYREGFITDIAPFVKLKQKHTRIRLPSVSDLY